MIPDPAPGEALIETRAGSNVLIRKVTLGVMHGEQKLDAILDTGATLCVVPPVVASLLGFNTSNRLKQWKVNVVGGHVRMDIHRLEYVQVGTAMVYGVTFGVANAGHSRFMLLGLPFIQQYNTTVDFDRARVLFRSRKAHKR